MRTWVSLQEKVLVGVGGLRAKTLLEVDSKDDFKNEMQNNKNKEATTISESRRVLSEMEEMTLPDRECPIVKSGRIASAMSFSGQGKMLN